MNPESTRHLGVVPRERSVKPPPGLYALVPSVCTVAA